MGERKQLVLKTVLRRQLEELSLRPKCSETLVLLAIHELVKTMAARARIKTELCQP